jgi:hypothetical protein
LPDVVILFLKVWTLGRAVLKMEKTQTQKEQAKKKESQGQIQANKLNSSIGTKSKSPSSAGGFFIDLDVLNSLGYTEVKFLAAFG